MGTTTPTREGREADGGSAITSYLVEWDSVSTFGSSDACGVYCHKGQASVPVTAGSQTSYTHTIQNLQPGKTYYVRVYAQNAVGPSDAQDREGLLGMVNEARLVSVSP